MTYQPPGSQPQPPPQPQYGAPQYYPPASPPASGASIASLVCGIISVLIGWIPVVGLIGLFTAIAAFITGLVGLQRPNGRPMAIIGLICGVLVIVLWIVGVVFVVIAAASHQAATGGG